MKLLSFIASGRASFGAVKDNGVVDLGSRMAPCTTLRQLLEAVALPKRQSWSPPQRPIIHSTRSASHL
ncbi:hypothetical protein ABIF65_002497 [Bradyrhizobium japonicum]|jgi:hypothetical protein|nr:hypothetical protein [Bradyrhizobium japonicum]MCP1780708.1 hypothetical protein [Bradyrhizobium japonicum]MCP1860055.1 hypothetical protein [Bradyrhizobium japonicum]MCP1890821.1 hypothetical protein [Bradyrhizobium japonicum]MCP1956299.1 hypothetical protein [Bradyrhizobium japonicum]